MRKKAVRVRESVSIEACRIGRGCPLRGRPVAAETGRGSRHVLYVWRELRLQIRTSRMWAARGLPVCTCGGRFFSVGGEGGMFGAWLGYVAVVRTVQLVDFSLGCEGL